MSADAIPARFDRHALIPGWNQSRLATAMVVVVGVGALGNEVARLLALSGVGTLLLCDPDRVTASNLSRAPLFRTADIGRPKVAAAADSLAALAPEMRAILRPHPLIHGIGLAELRDADVVMSCLDSRSARLQLADRCALVRAPSIDGGTHPWGGEVRPFLTPDGPCYGCTLSANERATVDAPWSCLDPIAEPAQGASAPISALVAAWMASIAVRFLFGLATPADALAIDSARGTTRPLTLTRADDCPLHIPIAPPRRLAIRATDTLAALRNAIGAAGVPLTWAPVMEQRTCPAPSCQFAEHRWGLPETAPCPRCGATLRPHTTLALDHAPGDLPLATLDIAPREILTVLGEDGMTWVELAG